MLPGPQRQSGLRCAAPWLDKAAATSQCAAEVQARWAVGSLLCSPESTASGSWPQTSTCAACKACAELKRLGLCTEASIQAAQAQPLNDRYAAACSCDSVTLVCFHTSTHLKQNINSLPVRPDYRSTPLFPFSTRSTVSTNTKRQTQTLRIKKFLNCFCHTCFCSPVPVSACEACKRFRLTLLSSRPHFHPRPLHVSFHCVCP